jgi:hypothetical protein
MMANSIRKTNLFLSLACLGLAFFLSSVVAQAADKPKYETEMPAGLKAPAEVETVKIHGINNLMSKEERTPK